MSTETHSGLSSHQELLNEIERLNGEIQVLEADLSKHKHISDRAIHYKHEARRRTVERNMLALVVVFLIAWLFYLQLTRPAVSEPKPVQGEIPGAHTKALAPDSENGESSGDE